MTTLSKSLRESYAYYNYDVAKNSQVFLKQAWGQTPSLVIFDEGRFEKQAALVTGSARLSHLKKFGDSLAGRFHEFRLHPLDLKELRHEGTLENNYQKLMARGGFPEPFFARDESESRRWRNSHLDVILRQDLLSLEVVRDLDSMEVLIELLSTRVGSTVSFNSLSEDLQVSDLTVKRWLRLLEDLYVVFRVSSYAKNLNRGLRKSGKYYFFDLGRVQGDESVKFEKNSILLKILKVIGQSYIS